MKFLSMNNNLIILCICGVLLCLCFWGGIQIAQNKPLWGDELYSHISSIEGKSYLEIISGKIEEGNNFPFFYLLQKVLYGLARYKSPQQWKKGQWDYSDKYSQIFLRLNPILFMSLAVVVVFFYFFRFHSIFSALLSLFLFLNSYMFWCYYAEARPYALWVFLTACQFLLFAYIVLNNKKSKNAWCLLIITHFLLSISVLFSLGQIAVVSFLLWIFVEKRWNKYILLTLIPIIITLFYYWKAPHYKFHFGNLSPEQLIRDCFSRDRFHFMLMYVFFLGICFIQKSSGRLKFFQGNIILEKFPFFVYTVLMLCFAAAVLFLFALKASPIGEGHVVISRYFIYLTPVGIISSTIFISSIFKSLLKNFWILLPVLYGISYLVIHRFQKNLPAIIRYCTGSY